MPANLGPEFLAAEDDYRSAETPAEKVAALEKMFATLPKHKGTEKMQADIRKRLSQARKDSQKKGAVHATQFYLVPREGAGQVALVGPANAGKSSLLTALTHARPEIADYPFTTRLPIPGMAVYENVQIQLVDLPALHPDFVEPWMPQALRHANALALVVDVEDPANLGDIEFIETTLQGWHLAPPGLLIANKIDRLEGANDFEVLAELFRPRYRCVAVSASTGAGLQAVGRALFDLLDLVRVYTKAPGRKSDFATPYVLKRGATVEDAARHVHKDFAEHLRFARLFRKSGVHDGFMVDRHHVLEDEDILEFHT